MNYSKCYLFFVSHWEFIAAFPSKDCKKMHSRYWKDFHWAFLAWSYVGIPEKSIVFVHQSPWIQVLKSRVEQSFIP